MARRTKDPSLLPEPEPDKPAKKRRVNAGQSRKLLDATVDAEPGARDPRLCDAPAVVRYPKPPDDRAGDYPPEMWGAPILDDNGERQYRDCGNFSIKGTHVCQSHGGSIPITRKSAEELLASCRDKLMETLLRLAFDETIEPRLRFDAMRWGLERAGFQAGVTVSLGVKPWQEALQAMKEQMGIE